MNIEQIKNEVKKNCINENVENLYLFGSVSENLNNKYSDIDFFVKGVKNIYTII